MSVANPFKAVGNEKLGTFPDPPELEPEHIELHVLQGHDVFPCSGFEKLVGKLLQG